MTTVVSRRAPPASGRAPSARPPRRTWRPRPGGRSRRAFRRNGASRRHRRGRPPAPGPCAPAARGGAGTPGPHEIGQRGVEDIGGAFTTRTTLASAVREPRACPASHSLVPVLLTSWPAASAAPACPRPTSATWRRRAPPHRRRPGRLRHARRSPRRSDGDAAEPGGVVVRFPAASEGRAARRVQRARYAVPTSAPTESSCIDGEPGSCYRVDLAAASGHTSCAMLDRRGGRSSQRRGRGRGDNWRVPGRRCAGRDPARAVASRSTPRGPASMSASRPMSQPPEPSSSRLAARKSTLRPVRARPASTSDPAGRAPPSTAATVTVRAIDLAGNAADSAPLAFSTPVALPPVTITEVLANAAGPEPQQEYVELRNLGAAEVSLAGLRLLE